LSRQLACHLPVVANHLHLGGSNGCKVADKPGLQGHSHAFAPHLRPSPCRLRGPPLQSLKQPPPLFARPSMSEGLFSK
jgi:hypothetical protein